MDSRQNQPKTGLIGQGNGQNSCCLHFCFTFVQIDFEIFDEYFLKWMWILSLLTSITYSLTPSTLNLGNIVAMTSKHRFTMASISLLRSFVCFVTLLLRTILLVERLVYNQSKYRSHMTSVSQSQLTEKLVSQTSSVCSYTPNGWIGSSRLQGIMT